MRPPFGQALTNDLVEDAAILRDPKADAMTATSVEQEAGFAPLAGDADARLAARSRAPDRRFWIGAAVALLLHSLLLIRVGTSAPTSLGTAGGEDNTISIDLVSEADLESNATVEEAKAGSPELPITQAPPQEAPPQPAPDAKAEAPPEQPEPTPEPAQETSQEPPVEPKPETPSETQTLSAADLAKEVPDFESIPMPGEKPAEKPTAKTAPVKPKPQVKPQEKKTARLDLSPPSRALNAPSGGAGGSAGFERPAGITRSGANDAFGRGVIAALQKSMPPHTGTNGRVTVRIALNPTGNVSDVKVLKPSGVGDIDEQVLFAARQTAYPFPAPNSKDVDRVFIVTYNYIER